jgi:uncharacterized protein (DUF433 family)
MAQTEVITQTYIVKTPGVVGGRARLEGTRVDVATIVAVFHSGASVEEIAAGFDHPGVTPARVHAALAYYYDHQEEIDSYLMEIEAEFQKGSKLDRARRMEMGLGANDNYLTSKEAAAKLSLDHESRRVAQLCRDGILDCQKVGRDWRISQRSVDLYAKSDRKPGRKG